MDLFCGAGGAAMGYFIAGFDVVGIDSNPQPDYPFKFIQADIRDIKPKWHRFAAVHSSPTCQVHSVSYHGRHPDSKREHIDLIPDARALCEASGLPYVIENVPGAPLIDPVTLCGSMFNLHTRRLRLVRHRLFELNWDLNRIPADRCAKWMQDRPRYTASIYGHTGKYWADGKDRHLTVAQTRQLMGMPWVRSGDSISQAIPPAYTTFLGYWLKQLV